MNACMNVVGETKKKCRAMEVFEISTRKGGTSVKRKKEGNGTEIKMSTDSLLLPFVVACVAFFLSRPFGVVGASLPAGGPLRRSLAKDERWRKVVTLKKESLDGLEKESFCAVSWKRDFFPPFPPFSLAISCSTV